MNDKQQLLKLISNAVEPEILVSPIDYMTSDNLYKIIESKTEEAISMICNTDKNNITKQEFVGLYEDVESIIKKRILIK